MRGKPLPCVPGGLTLGLSVVLLHGLAPAIQAGYVSHHFSMNQSNELADGVVYGSVHFEAYDGIGPAGGGLSAGQVRLTLSATQPPAYGGVGKNFGIQKFGFMTSLSIPADDISGPAGWSVGFNRTMDGFGRFSVVLSGTGSSRVNPAVITISNLGSGARLENFLVGSRTSSGDVPPEGAAYFAAHVAGFKCQPGSHYIAAPAVVREAPVPPTWALALAGSGCWGVCSGWRGWRRRDLPAC
ncbi:MAG: hypothetical protein NZ700_00445 [Gemmataceae bacterium]|nr:hypothetical protein [Gemmataceae bacterium]MDW8265447.1 hypothetical protein [Gemmataceae bacterium]